MKCFTRRGFTLGLPAVVAGAAVVLKAQTPSPGTSIETDMYNKAREGKRAASEELAKFELPMATEPASHFKA
jgi:hypothetical protein